jgi:NAD(P)-dependent dehydrogenase (short-subunit alcohol dehydrogenase family)
VARRRVQWKKYQGRVDSSRLIFIDETWAKTDKTRTHGRAPRGSGRVFLRFGLLRGGHFFRTRGVVAGAEAAQVSAEVCDFGRLDVIINCAGIMLIRPMTEMNAAEWETTIDLNIKGTLWAIAAVLPIFLSHRSGHIINLGSVHGLKVFSPGGAVHFFRRTAR